MVTALAQSLQRYWLAGWLIIWAALLFGGFIWGNKGTTNRRMPTWTRMASSAALVAAAFSWFIFSRHTPIAGYALLIAIGMTCGFLGDLWLAGQLPGGRNTIAGIISFGVGHLFYIAAMIGLVAPAGLANSLLWVALAFWWLVALAGWYIVVFRGATRANIPLGLVHGLALPYALLLGTTAGLATGLALADGRFALLALGTALFLFSDIILAGEMFCGFTFPLIGDVIWLTYGPAQLLIVYSIGYALALVEQI